MNKYLKSEVDDNKESGDRSKCEFTVFITVASLIISIEVRAIYLLQKYVQVINKLFKSTILQKILKMRFTQLDI